MKLAKSYRRLKGQQFIAGFMALLILNLALPIEGAFAAAPSVSPKPSRELLAKQSSSHPTKARTGPHRLTKITPRLGFSSTPADADLINARVFSEPLVPLSGNSQPGENTAVANTLINFKRDSSQDSTPLKAFVEQYPHSRWTPAIELNLGTLLFNQGYLSQGMSLWKSAWESSKDEKGLQQKALADRAFGLLVRAKARLGETEELRQLLTSVEHRSFFGTNESLVKDARGGLSSMDEHPNVSFKCGPYAVYSLLSQKQIKTKDLQIVEDAVSTKRGTNLAQVEEWAKKAGLNYQLAKRSPGAVFVLPAILHWKVGHFAAIVSKQGSNFIVKDPTFDTDGTASISASALESETDGFFLVPADKLPDGWTPVSKEEAANIWGKGYASGRGYGDPPPRLPSPPSCDAGGNCSCGGDGGGGGGPSGMAKASILPMQATLNIWDAPLEYSPPLGNKISFSVNYRQLQPNQPSSFTFTNLGTDWNFQYLSYLTVATGTNVATLVAPGGVAKTYTPSGGVYPPDALDQSQLTAISGGYQIQMPDGSVQTYNQTDGTGRIFMTQWSNPQGNSVLIQYDSTFRITTITDAINQVSTLSYVSNTVGNSGYYVLAGISDPFGRTCSFAYDSTNTLLLSITDQISLKSQFVYDSSSSFISSMTTPYGTSSFYTYVPGNLAFPAQGIRVTLPDGTYTVTENWIAEGHLSYTYFWDREKTMLYPNDPANRVYSHCDLTNFVYDPATNLERSEVWSVTKPLETASVTNYSYPGQSNPNVLGTSNRPSAITRALGGQPLNATIGGTVTVGDQVGLNVNNIGYLYLVKTGDTLATIASGLANVINTSPQVQTTGVLATVNNTVLTISTTTANTSFGLTGYTTSETVTLTPVSRQTSSAIVGGTATVGDTLTIQLSIPIGTYPSISHTVISGDTLSSIATALASGINANTTLQALGVTAIAAGTNVSIFSFNYLIQNLGFSLSSGATETLTQGPYVRNFNNQTSNFVYNSFGLPTLSVDPMDRTISQTYATNNIDLLQTTETQASDNYSMGSWTYNSYHRPLTYTDGSGQVTHYTYNSSNQLLTLEDANGNTTTNTYTGTNTATIGGTITAGNVLTVTVHDAGLTGGTEPVNYTVVTGDTLTSIATKLAAAVNADTKLQAIGVSASGSAAVVTLKSTSVNVTTYTESTSGGATETIAIGSGTFGYLTKVDGPLAGSNDITTFTYDIVGRLASTSDSEGYVVTYQYDNADRLTTTTYPDGSTEQILYDRLDAVFSKDRIGRWSQSSYDELDRLAYQIDPLGRKTTYTWCTCGSLAALTDPAGHTTSWNHDLEGRPIKKTYADGTSVRYVYDPYSSRLLQKTDALNQTTTYRYYFDGRLYQKGYLNAVNATGVVTSNWDNFYPRLTSVNKSDWGTYSYTYNPYIAPGGGATTGGGRLQLISNSVIPNSNVTYQYDALGRTTNRSINGSSNSDTWTFDAMSRVTAESNVLGNFAFAYVDDTPGSSKGTTRLKSVTYPNSQVTNYSWYPNLQDQRLQEISNLNPSGGTLSQFNYGYDSAGEITQWQQQQNGGNLVYNLGYDLAGQLVSAQAGSGASERPYAKESYYTYDAASNRTAVQSGAVDTVRVGGTKTTGDILTITVNDVALSGGQEVVSYTVLSGDTLSSIALGLATALNTDTKLQALGVTANAHGTNTFVNIRSASTNITTYTPSVSGGATETLTFGIFKNGIENANIGGTKTTGDVLTLTVLNAALSGGTHSVSYTVISTDTLTTIATALKSAINADTTLQSLGVTATSVGTTININSTSINATNYTSSVTGTETISLAPNVNEIQLASVGGTKTTGDVLTITAYDAGLTGGKQAISYTVVSADTLTTIATGLAAAINASTQLQAIGVSATSSGAVVTIQSNSLNQTTYRQTFNSSATESVAIAPRSYGWQVAALGGTKKTGDVLSLTFFDANLSGGKETVSYTVASADTLTTIATNLAAAINADTNLQAISVSGSASSTVVSVESLSPNLTTVAQSVTSGSTETISLGLNYGLQRSGYNLVNELTSISPGGPALYQGVTSKPVQSASLASPVVNIQAALPSTTTTFTASASGTPTETVSSSVLDGYNNVGPMYSMTVGGTPKVGDVINLTVFDVRIPNNGSQTVSYTVQSGDTPTSIASGLGTAMNNTAGVLYNLGFLALNQGNANLVFQAQVASAATTTNSTFASASITSTATETISTSQAGDENSLVTVGGTATAGDVVSLTVENSSLPGGSQTVSYTVLSTDTPTTIATALKNAINAATALATIGVSATSSGAVVSFFQYPYYTSSVSGSGTETVTFSNTDRGNAYATIGGKPTTGDVLSIVGHNASLSGGSQTASYTVVAGDTLLSIAQGLTAAINANTGLKTLGVSAGSAATLAWSQSFSGKNPLAAGANLSAVSAIDGNSNTKTNDYQVGINGGSASTLTFDANGNMTSDGTNTYQWDAENRLIQINYPGTGNYTTFGYDGLNRNVIVVETTNGSATSSIQFVWCGNKRCEVRTIEGSITAQLNSLGETIGGSVYLFSTDHLGLVARASNTPIRNPNNQALTAFEPISGSASVRELTNSSGIVESRYLYDPFGQTTQLTGIIRADLQYAGYFTHARSGLNLTVARAYSQVLGRWISRDPLEELAGANLYLYVANIPVQFTDPLGLYFNFNPRCVTTRLNPPVPYVPPPYGYNFPFPYYWVPPGNDNGIYIVDPTNNQMRDPLGYTNLPPSFLYPPNVTISPGPGGSMLISF